MKKIMKAVNLLTITSILLTPVGCVSAKTKNETVYTNLDSYGNIEKTSITNHLFANDKDIIEDETELKEILNINGNENYTMEKNHILWNSFGKDIYYKGTVDKILPIEIKIKYYLDDKEQDVKEMIGKSGKVKIQMDFQNHMENQVYVNGTNAKLYTPFVITTGLILNNEENRDIEINNGKVVDSGTRNIVLGIASPGMYENFKIKELEELDKIIVTYETENFSLGDIYVVATPKLLEESDLKIFDKINNLSKNMDILQSSINEIELGAKKLEEGSSALTLGSDELVKNLKSLLNAVEQLEAGSIQIEGGLEKIVAQLQSLSGSINNPNTAGSLASLQNLKQKNTEARDALLAQTGMDYNTLKNYYQANLVNYVGTDPATLSLKSTCELVFLLNANNEAINQTLTSLSSIDGQVGNILTILTSTLTELKNGSSKVATGLTQVKNGLSKLYDGSMTLNQGTKTLGSGISELTMGITKFNQEGIQTLSRYSKTISNYNNKAKSLVNLSKNYRGFASNNADNTTLIYMIKSPKK